MASPTVPAGETLKALPLAIPTAGMYRKSLGVDGFELGGLSGDSQEHFGDLSHAEKTSDLRSQLNTDDFKLVEWRSGVLRSCEVCLSNTGFKESHVGLVTGCEGRIGNGQLSMQGFVLQTWCGKNSTHPLSCVVAPTRRGTTTDCDHQMLGRRRTSPKTPCGDCWECLDWPRAKVERSKL